MLTADYLETVAIDEDVVCELSGDDLGTAVAGGVTCDIFNVRFVAVAEPRHCTRCSLLLFLSWFRH